MVWKSSLGPSCGCCDGDPYAAVHCVPCEIPGTDLAISWYYWRRVPHDGAPPTYVVDGPLDFPLTYTPSPVGDLSSGTWSSGWQPLPDGSVTCFTPAIGSPTLCCYVNFVLTCDDGGTLMTVGLSSTPSGLGSLSYCQDGTVRARVGPQDVTCDPFLIEYGCPVLSPESDPADCFVGALFYTGVVSLG